MIGRRNLLLSTVAAVGAAAVGGYAVLFRGGRAVAENAPGEQFEITKTPAQWRETLTRDQYAVLREEATERPGTSEWLHEKREGNFTCAGCDLPLYASKDKYDSGTGWPSFTQALPDAVRTRTDNKLFMTRTEVHCRRCGGHLGHVFNDGPPPTGKRHCINGVALKFVPA